MGTKRRKAPSMTLLHILGSETMEVYYSFLWQTHKSDERHHADANFHILDCIFQKFNKYCSPEKNVTIERHISLSWDSCHDKTSVTELGLTEKICNVDSPLGSCDVCERGLEPLVEWRRSFKRPTKLPPYGRGSPAGALHRQPSPSGGHFPTVLCTAQGPSC